VLTERRFAWARAMGVAALGRGLVGTLQEELDYRIEASNTASVAQSLREYPTFEVPTTHPDLSTGRRHLRPERGVVQGVGWPPARCVHGELVGG
jgi:predicted unusual protein kinase regulating ubiquinone biosynthesis (AarF/ABC1/UbiB family)